MTILCLRKLPSRPWMVSRLGWRGWRFSSSVPRTTANPTDPSPGAFPLPSSNASIARVSLPLSQGHHCRDSLGQGGRSHHRREIPSNLKNKKLQWSTFHILLYCIPAFLSCNLIQIKYFIVYDYLWLLLSQCLLEVFCVTVFSGEHQVCFHATSLPSGQA